MSAALQRDDTCKFTCLVKVETVEGTDREAKTNIIYFCIFTSAFKVILEGICLCHRQVLTCLAPPLLTIPIKTWPRRHLTISLGTHMHAYTHYNRYSQFPRIT